MREKGRARAHTIDERHSKRHEVVAANRQRVREFATIQSLHERVQQQQTAEVHRDAFEPVDFSSRERGPHHRPCREPRCNDNADCVHDDGRDVAREQADHDEGRTLAPRPRVMQQRECHHHEGRDHEIDPGAGLLDQKHTFRREVTFAGDRRERDTRDRTGKLRCRCEDPRERIGAGVGVVALEAVGHQRHEHQHAQFEFHLRAPSDVPMRRARNKCVAPRSAIATAITQINSGSAPLVTPTALFDTPSGNGNG